MGNIVLVGVGGTGISSLAYLFHDLGYTNVVGVDAHESEITTKLYQYGVDIIIGSGVYQVQKDDFVIYSDAAEKSKEVQQSLSYVGTSHKKIFPPLSYFQFLGELSKYFQTIAIAGTHGKSTTTALIGTVLAKSHQHFGLAFCGAPVVERNDKNVLLNQDHKNNIKSFIDHILSPTGNIEEQDIKKYFCVIEADEYNHHFLLLDVDYALITNIELDHIDVYKNFDVYLDAFVQFVQRVRKKVFLLPGVLGINSLQDKYGKNDKIVEAEKICFSFKYLLGAHNHDNASLGFAFMCYLMPGKNLKSLKKAFEMFKGLRRRGELLGYNKHHVPIITDYGHHPTEMASVYTALREKYPNQSITCIFQAHQARRVIEFWEHFTKILQKFDKIILYSIYTARENIESLKAQFQEKKFLDKVYSFEDLGNQFAKKVGGKYVLEFSEITSLVEQTHQGIIIIFTAGDLDWYVRKWIGNCGNKI